MEQVTVIVIGVYSEKVTNEASMLTKLSCVSTLATLPLHLLALDAVDGGTSPMTRPWAHGTVTVSADGARPVSIVAW